MTEQEIIKILDSYFNRESPPKFVNVSRVPLICQDIKQIKSAIVELKDSISKKTDDHEGRIRKLEQGDNYVSKDDFTNIKNIVYGGCAVILVAVLSALVYMVVKH